MFANANIAVMGAFRANFRLTFFNAALLDDTEGLLVKSGPNAQHPSVLKFDDNAQVARRGPAIRAYLQQAMAFAAAGTKAPKTGTELVLPIELLDALDANPELAEAFHNLTRGRQKSYVLNLADARKSQTRIARIIGFRDKILAGKGALDR